MAWWRSRSSRATAVVCSGRKRPRCSNGQWLATPRLRLVGGGDEGEEELGAGLVKWREAELVDVHVVVSEQVVDDATDSVVGEAAVERLDQLVGSEVADAQAGADGGVAKADQEVAFPGVGRTDQHRAGSGRDPLEAGEVVEGGLRDRRL